MKYRYCILGAGRQGLALAYDLAKNGEAQQIVLADSVGGVAQRGVERLRGLLPQSRVEFVARDCDVADSARVAEAIGGANVVLSAVPYRFNVELTDAAIAAGASFNDLGGNTGVVRGQLSRHEPAKARGVSVVPDCGLAPGLGNTLAAHAIESLDQPEEVHVRCGGLPQERIGELGYKLVFNFQGLANEYSGFGEFLRDGKRIDVPALSEQENIEFASPVGRCEAAVTSGGTSTCPDSFAGRVRTYDYKTVRYPGHWAIIRAMFQLGCFDESVKLRNGTVIQPKPVTRALFEENLDFPAVRDLVVLRIVANGRHKGRARTIQHDLFDLHDETTGFTAMERTTAFPAALVAYFQARGLVKPGALPLERAIPNEQYVRELPNHDIRIETQIRDE